ncbi:Cytochrome c oxidase subunit 4 isoform 1, mitochondrial [Geodia barretti]|uniref:Cytochrome c oxidase subunit 4 isoform 1, mitochondrial n=1 Tax=Geodia barretti TaxID=519541 RepID=A0AA35TTZ1_GEOBA|nr:Cytochrome c oxidase subunit 4 isoform 1, mitochondrial [Geodia barretti]
MAIPAPLNNVAVLETPELQQLARKAQGPWTELSNEEAVELYRAQFPLSLREIHEDTKSDMKTVLPAVILLMALSVWGASFLRNTIGPEQPHTFNNPEWDAATREKLIKYKANPIEGISSGLQN